MDVAGIPQGVSFLSTVGRNDAIKIYRPIQFQKSPTTALALDVRFNYVALLSFVWFRDVFRRRSI
jgi:hypothetical protein